MFLPLIELSTGWIVAIDFLAWPLIHLGVSWLAFRRDPESFDPESFLYRERKWERGSQFYRERLLIAAWKNRLPDGAKLFPGAFRKGSLQWSNASYLHRFLLETCRGEWAHWVTLIFTPLFFLWNPPWAWAVLIAYGLAANLPCIVVQRHNRIVLRRIQLMERTQKSKKRLSKCNVTA